VSLSMQNIEIHPNWYFDIPIMRTLILGSFPPHADKRRFQFYYPNPQNNAAVIERKAILLQLQVGVENMGQKIIRQGKSAKDTAIEIINYHAVLDIINQHPELETILLAGYSAKHSTFRSFCNYCQQMNIPYELPEKIQAEIRFHIQIKQRRISCVILHSTSTASRLTLEALVKEYKKYIKSP
jgi:G:T/U-mismatch repair DNA glycosylase